MLIVAIAGHCIIISMRVKWSPDLRNLCEDVEELESMIIFLVIVWFIEELDVISDSAFENIKGFFTRLFWLILLNDLYLFYILPGFSTTYFICLVMLVTL